MNSLPIMRSYNLHDDPNSPNPAELCLGVLDVFKLSQPFFCVSTTMYLNILTLIIAVQNLFYVLTL